MRILFAPALFALLANPVQAQTLFEGAAGQYGSASDPATSCAANPHELTFETSPPHVNLTWTTPKDSGIGPARTNERYDLEDHDDTSMILREEGPWRDDSDGGGRFWVLQLTQNPPGYCWRRPDWPAVRCEDQQLRCENATS